MLAAILVISIFSGAAGVAVMQMLDLPFWASLVAYPVAGSVGLMAAAALATIAQSSPRHALERVSSATLRPTRQP